MNKQVSSRSQLVLLDINESCPQSDKHTFLFNHLSYSLSLKLDKHESPIERFIIEFHLSSTNTLEPHIFCIILLKENVQ
jgi:hypothetical protein